VFILLIIYIVLVIVIIIIVIDRKVSLYLLIDNIFDLLVTLLFQ